MERKRGVNVTVDSVDVTGVLVAITTKARREVVRRGLIGEAYDTAAAKHIRRLLLLMLHGLGHGAAVGSRRRWQHHGPRALLQRGPGSLGIYVRAFPVVLQTPAAALLFTGTFHLFNSSQY